MLAHLEPSVEMTGGPWYTDNELDTEFIKLLCSACLRFIRDKVSVTYAPSINILNICALFVERAETKRRRLGFFKPSLSHLRLTIVPHRTTAPGVPKQEPDHGDAAKRRTC